MVEVKHSSKIVSVNPSTARVLGEVAASSDAEVKERVGAARKAFEKWRQLPIATRLERVENFRRLLMKEKDSVAAAITREAGKPFAEALISEVFGTLEVCTWLKGRAPSLLRKKRVAMNQLFFFGKRSYNIHEPKGVIAVISPWNYPFCIPATSMLMALAAGNAVVLKPSPRVPFVASTLVNLLVRAGFPPELVGLVQGDKETAESLIAAGVDHVVFTGSVPGGKAIMEIASRQPVPVTLELGGKHPAIVLGDSDPDKIAGAIVWSAFTNAGQACASIDRLYVHKSVARRLLLRIVELSARLRLGDPLNPSTDVGPLIDESSMERCRKLVEEAIAGGATVLAGGRARPELGGYFFEPTVLQDVTGDMRISSEEIFGPILPVTVFDDEALAIAMANNSSLALAASVWSSDIKHAEALVSRLNAGVVWVNDGLYSHVCPDAPWGGMKASGFGRTHSEHELLDYVNIKHVGVSSQGMRDWHYPYSQAGLAYLMDGMDLVHGEGSEVKLKALARLCWSKLGQSAHR